MQMAVMASIGTGTMATTVDAQSREKVGRSRCNVEVAWTKLDLYFGVHVMYRSVLLCEAIPCRRKQYSEGLHQLRIRPH